MMSQPPRPVPMSPEKVAYWYLRLNGFFQIENFIVHPTGRGGQRTDADLLAVRFPFRAERLFDDARDIMADDQEGLVLSPDRIDVVIAEVKTSSACTLNGPWTRRKDENVHRVLAAIGCVRPDWIESAAQSIYDSGAYDGEPGLRIRLVAIGARENPELRLAYPAVTQLTWPQVLRFIWQRFRDYRRQKTQVEQWDADGKRLKSWADRAKTPERFVEVVLDRMGVLLGYRRFGPELLMLDLVADTSTKGTFIDTKANSGIAGAGGGNKYKTIGTVLQELDPGMLDRFEALRAYMMALGDDVQETTPRFYIAFKRIKNFACVEFRPSTCQILMFVKVDPSTVQLEPGFTRDVSNLRHFGDGGLEITLSTAGDLDRAKPLIELSYGAS